MNIQRSEVVTEKIPLIGSFFPFKSFEEPKVYMYLQLVFEHVSVSELMTFPRVSMSIIHADW